MPAKRDAVERFQEKTKTSITSSHRGVPCIEWTASINAGGYGVFRPISSASSQLAHRWAYERWVGPIPHDQEIDHLCRNRCCVNVLHLDAVTRTENMHRIPEWGTAEWSAKLTKTYCKRGHPYDETNTYYPPTGNRKCRKCMAIRMKAYWERRKSGQQPWPNGMPRTHCKRGHELTPENTHIYVNGTLTCRACRNLWARTTAAEHERAEGLREGKLEPSSMSSEI